MLTAFSVENYRAFARRQDVDIRPLTLFFGWNSGGKSALVRFLPLLAESVQASGPPIWLAGNVGRDTMWSDLVCKATERSNLGFALRWPGSPQLSAEWDVGGDAGGRWQAIKSLRVAVGTDASSVDIPDNAEGQWDGPLPRIDSCPAAADAISLLRDALHETASEIQWISGVRALPRRLAVFSGSVIPTIYPDGRNAVDYLIAAQLRVAAPILETVQRFFAALGEQLVLDNPMEGAWRLLLHPSQAPHVRVNLCDTGEGYAQVLPVLVALARARVGGPRLLCLEQPELHLHTHAQAELAKSLVETAKHQAAPRILLETHSEVLLMSIQLAIAKGDITSDMVRVYWVESRADGTSDAVPVDFDEQGRPTNTALIGAFTEAVRLGQELVRMQLPKMPS